jgi:hypothetical protein
MEILYKSSDKDMDEPSYFRTSKLPDRFKQPVLLYPESVFKSLISKF